MIRAGCRVRCPVGSEVHEVQGTKESLSQTSGLLAAVTIHLLCINSLLCTSSGIAGLHHATIVDLFAGRSLHYPLAQHYNVIYNAKQLVVCQPATQGWVDAIEQLKCSPDSACLDPGKYVSPLCPSLGTKPLLEFLLFQHAGAQ